MSSYAFKCLKCDSSHKLGHLIAFLKSGFVRHSLTAVQKLLMLIRGLHESYGQLSVVGDVLNDLVARHAGSLGKGYAEPRGLAEHEAVEKLNNPQKHF